MNVELVSEVKLCFLVIMSYEIRIFMNGVIGMLDMLGELYLDFE